MAARVEIDERAVAELLGEPEVQAAIGEVADRVAHSLAAAAPKRTGAAARSIHAEPDQHLPGAFRVSWDRSHFYVSLAHGLDFVDRALSQFR